MLVKESKRPPRRKEKTGSQTITYSFGDGLLQRDYSKVGTYDQLRDVRKDPTVQLARSLMVSCILAGSWNIEAEDDVNEDIVEFMKHILVLREDLLYNTIAFGKIDFGWVGFEKLFKIKDNRIVVEALKPLLHDITRIMVTKNGRFNGFHQQSILGSAIGVEILPEKCLHIAFDVEAGNYYGIPLLENIRQSHDDWDDCNDGAKRYDLKLAGTHWVIKFPPGTGTVDGESVDNGIIAGTMLEALKSSGSVSIPTTTVEVLQEIINAQVADLYAWSVELLDDKGGKQAGFGERLKYLDAQKVRGLLVPERAILEGQFGTKAEAGTHGDSAVIIFEAIDRLIIRVMNQQVVNQLLYLNFGEALVNKVRLVAAPLIDKQISFLREIYKELSKTDPNIDLVALKEKLDIPTEEGGTTIPGKEEE